jgi:hypothetical protein
MRIIGFENIEFDETVARVDAWYDRSLRLWTCLWLNAAGDQLGVAQYANRKAEKDQLVKAMERSVPANWQIAF